MLPSSTVENYLKTIYHLQARLTESGTLVPMGRIAAALDVVPGTATTMVKALAESGLVRYEPYAGARLTPSGEKLAALVLRRHRLVELFLVEIMGMNWTDVHEEAEHLEHAVSDRLIERMDEMLGHPDVDPHGDPIPRQDGTVARTRQRSLLTCPLDTPVVVSRVLDQQASFLRFLEDSQLKPGRRIEVEARDEAADSVRVRHKGRRITLGARAASKVLVELAVVLLLAAGPSAAQDTASVARAPQDTAAAVRDLPPDVVRLLERLDARIRQLEEQVAESERRIAELLSRTPAASMNLPGPALSGGPERPGLRTTTSEAEPSPTQPVASGGTTAEVEGETRLPFSGYMDFHFNNPRDGESQLDFHRFVLLFGHSFSDRLKFWSELELEHALVEGLEEKGELELEQAYVDYNLMPSVNLRAGMLLAPVGIINERHEPPAYYGVERPFVDTLVVPSTWFDTGAGVFGDLGRGLTYKVYVMAPLDATGFTAEEGIRGGRQKGFLSNVRHVAFTGRVEHHAAAGLALGASVWSGLTGFNLQTVNPRVTLWDVDGRLSRGRLDLRGQYAQVTIGDAGELNAALQRQTGVNPNIARALRGFYLESGVRVLPATFPHDLAVFLRYENFDTQWRMPSGYLPLQEFDRDAWILGASYFLDPDIALKADYTWVRNRSEVVRPPRAFNVGLGWWF